MKKKKEKGQDRPDSVHFMVRTGLNSSIPMCCAEASHDPDNSKWSKASEEQKCKYCKKILEEIKVR